MAARALRLAAAAGKVSALPGGGSCLLGKQMGRLTSTTPAAPAAEASNPAPAGSPEPGQNAPKPDGQSESEREAKAAWRLQTGIAAAGALLAGSYAVFEARQQRETTKEALAEMKSATAKVEAEMKSATAEVKMVAATEQQKAEKNLDKHVIDAKEAIRLQREALQVQHKALEDSVKMQQEAVNTQTRYATIGPLAASALGFVVAYAGAGLINRSGK